MALEKTLESPLDFKEIQPVHPKGNQSECSLEGLMLKLKLQYFDHQIWRTDSLEKIWCWERLKAGREGDDREWDGWMASPTQWTWVWVNSGSWWRTRKPGMPQSMGHKELDTTKQLNWTELKQPFTEVQVKCSCVVLTACRLKCLGEYMKYHKQQLWLSYLGTKVSSSLPHKNHNHNRS